MPLKAFLVADDSPTDPNVLLPVSPTENAPLFQDSALNIQNLLRFFDLQTAGAGVKVPVRFSPAEIRTEVAQLEREAARFDAEYEQAQAAAQALQESYTAAPAGTPQKAELMRRRNSAAKHRDQLDGQRSLLRGKIDRYRRGLVEPEKGEIKTYQENRDNPLTIERTEVGRGYWIHLKSRNPDQPPPSFQKYAVFDAWREALNEQIQKVYYVYENSQVTGSLPKLVRLEIDQMAYIGFDRDKKNSQILPAMGLQSPGPHDLFTGGHWLNCILVVNNGGPGLKQFFRDYGGGTKDDCVLWIPKVYPVLFRAADDSQIHYVLEDDKITPRETKRASSVGVYAIRGDGGFNTFDAEGEPVTFGAGGGAMRSDRVTEVEYAWDGPPALGYALGLDLDRHFSILSTDAATLRARGFYESPLPTPGPMKTPVRGDMQSEITYFKQFKTADSPQAAGKLRKNAPHLTKPLQFRRFSKVGAEAYLQSGLVLKKKGTWAAGPEAAGRAGEPLKKGNTDRSSAGAVMKRVFDEMELKPQNVDLRSATKFAEFVVGSDATANEFWKALSRELSPYPNLNLSIDDLRREAARVRTDQEWCHLYGHGDGGKEEEGNFISGSKHCNTLQLAIECGQRSRADLPGQNFTIKVTGYLFPNEGFQKRGFTGADLDYLNGFAWPGLRRDTPGFPDALRLAMAVVISGNFEHLYRILPERATPGAETPTAVEFAALPGDRQARIRQNVVERFQRILKQFYPLGSVVRYKIYMNGKKIFDHSYNAQLESFDYNEFKILESTVRRVVAAAQGRSAEYVEYINHKAQVRRNLDAKPVDAVQRLTPYKLP